MHILVRLDKELERQLKRVVPPGSRGRSEFVRRAIWRAIMALEEEKTREAYLRVPDTEGEYFDPEEWEPEPFPQPKGQKKRP